MSPLLPKITIQNVLEYKKTNSFPCHYTKYMASCFRGRSAILFGSTSPLRTVCSVFTENQAERPQNSYRRLVVVLGIAPSRTVDSSF